MTEQEFYTKVDVKGLHSDLETHRIVASILFSDLGDWAEQEVLVENIPFSIRDRGIIPGETSFRAKIQSSGRISPRDFIPSE